MACKTLTQQRLELLGGSLAPGTSEWRWIVKITPYPQSFYEDTLFFLELIPFIQTPLPHRPRQAPTRERWGERLIRRDTDASNRHYTT